MDFRNPHFAEPAWLWLALLGPLALVALQVYSARVRRRQLAQLASPEMLHLLLTSHSPARRAVKQGALVVCLAGLGLAMARPQWGETTEISQALGGDVLFVLDCSKSMLATDVQPSRIGRAKYAILDFVQKHGRGRVGLVAFAGQAFLQCPLTFDYDSFREALLDCDERTIPVAGTDIGRALEEGAAAMEKNDRRKAMVLVTDGEDLAGSAVQTARKLAAQGVVVYAIGVGTRAGSPIRIFNEQGAQDLLKDPEGKAVVSRLDETTLGEIAEVTHGAYHPLGSLGEGLEQVRRQVENSANTRDVSQLRKLGVERFQLPLAAAAILLVSESLVGTRRRKWHNPV